jgi:hypothetical protein
MCWSFLLFYQKNEHVKVPKIKTMRQVLKHLYRGALDGVLIHYFVTQCLLFRKDLEEHRKRIDLSKNETIPLTTGHPLSVED